MRKSIAVFLAVFGFTSFMFGQQNLTQIDLGIFPEPMPGYKQVVINLPHSLKDSTKKVEFYVGETISTDTCNSYWLIGELQEKDLPGWGYSYYVFQSDGVVASTQMGCLDNTQKMSFVSSTPELITYNGKMPILIYVPDQYQVRYKIYKTDQEEFQGVEVAAKKQ
ncbi:ecotin family protein [Myroides sp. LJL119]